MSQSRRNHLALKIKHDSVNWEIETERREFLRYFVNLVRNWTMNFPNLRKIFLREEIDWLLMEIVSPSNKIWPLTPLYFVVHSDYEDVPVVGQDGKISWRRKTPLHCVPRTSNFSVYTVVVLLFEIYNTFNVNYTDENGLTHFHIACEYGCYDVVEKFLKFDQDPNLLLPKTGNRPLHLAVTSGMRAQYGLLLRHGADPNLVNKCGWTPLHIICQYVQYHGDNGDDSARIFFNACDEINREVEIDARDRDGNTPLHLALANGRKRVAVMLMRRGADLNSANEQGSTPLHVICQRKKCGDDNLTKLFFRIVGEINRSVKVDALDKFGDAPLHLALANGLDKDAVLLLRRGTDPNLANKRGSTPLHVICQRKKDKDDNFAELFFQIVGEMNQLVRVNARDNSGNTPLHLALANGRDEVALMLLRRGTDPNLANEQGSTPLHVICQREKDNNDNVAELFFQIVGEINQSVRVNARDNSGNTPLHLALANGRDEVAVKLLRRGANANLPNEAGDTPMHIIFHYHRYDNDDLLKRFLEISKEVNQLLQVDVRNPNGRTPLELAVANLMLNRVELLLNYGADVSSFVFPTTKDLDEGFTKSSCEFQIQCKLSLVSSALSVVECLENGGYRLERSDALTIMKLFAQWGLFEKAVPCITEGWLAQEAKSIRINLILTMHDLFLMPAKEATTRLLIELKKSRDRPQSGLVEACVTYLCEKLSRQFFESWALDSLYELIKGRLPIECCSIILDGLTHKDLYNIFLGVLDRRP